MKKYKCKFCEEPATHAVRWAEGRAIVPCCAKHQAKARNISKDVANDPSAKLVKLGQFERGFQEELEKIALSDEYFVEKKLYPNIDFYSGITLKALGFPTDMFTVLFALARTVGWIAQWKEMVEDPSQRIGRPRQLYTGATERSFVPMSDR